MPAQLPSPAAATFIFDGGCGFCARAARALGSITVGGRPGPFSLDDGPAPSFHIASSSDFPFDEIGVDATLIERHALYVEVRRGASSPGADAATRPGADDEPAPPSITSSSPAPPFVALGHEAIGHALRDHGRTRFWRFAGAVLLNPLVRAPASIAYRLVADNRGAVSRVTEAVVKQARRH